MTYCNVHVQSGKIYTVKEGHTFLLSLYLAPNKEICAALVQRFPPPPSLSLPCWDQKKFLTNNFEVEQLKLLSTEEINLLEPSGRQKSLGLFGLFSTFSVNSFTPLYDLEKCLNLAHTGCEGYCRPFFKMVSCINRLSDHDKIFTVYPPLHLLLSTGVLLPARLKGPRQENQRAVIVKIIRAVWGKMDNKKN